ncbi:unnamed protein product, partial [Symbiodinium sp. CCMP2456]
QVQQVSEQVAQMQATRPEMIRAAPVWKILRGLARPLRGAAGDFYDLSQTTTRLNAFWSHSWHGSAKHKIATIFFLHKASAATILGTTSAVIAGVLYGLKLLPGFGAEGRSCWWCVMTGSLTYLLVLLFWQPRELVFVDRVCISQTDPGLQAEGLLSLGAMLKSSDSMLVLWDPSWARRLWCVFELAAFIRSRPEGSKPHVVLRPTILGFAILAFGFSAVLGTFCYYSLFHVFPGTPVYFIMLLALLPFGVVFFLIASLARAYCRSVTTMCRQIGEFRIATAESYCCSTDHKSATGEPMICDRQVIQQCINIWFGSVEAFERRVQNEVCDLLSHQLAYHMISYWRLSEATPICFWMLLDQSAERLYSGLQEGHSGSDFGVQHLIRGIIYWLAVVPFIFRVLLRVTWMLQAQPPCHLLDWFLSFLVLFVGAALLLSIIFLDLFGGFYAFVFTSIPLALFTWRYLPVPITVERWDGNNFAAERRFDFILGGEFVRLRLDLIPGASGAVVVDYERKVKLQEVLNDTDDPADKRDTLEATYEKVEADVAMTVADWPPELVSSVTVTQSFVDAWSDALRAALVLRLSQPLGVHIVGFIGLATVENEEEGYQAFLCELQRNPTRQMLQLMLRAVFAFFAVAASAKDFDLILYGADGCVGHFAAQHLAVQKSLTWAIAGRNGTKLESLKEDLKSLGDISEPSIVVASLDGKSDPKEWVQRTRAVITAAGPFSIHGGELLLKACAELGVNYADTSDEFYWQRWMVDRYDAVAKKSGAQVVLSSGFCALAGDLGAQLAMTEVVQNGSEVKLDAWLEKYNGGVSAGVINTAKVMKNVSYPKAWDSDPYVLTPNISGSLRKDTKVEGMGYPSYVSGEGLVVANIFGPYDARLMRRNSDAELVVWVSTPCPTKSVFKDGSWAYRFKASSGGRSSTVLLCLGCQGKGARVYALSRRHLPPDGSLPTCGDEVAIGVGRPPESGACEGGY